MLTILGVTFPFFALVLAGYIAAKRGWLPLTAIPGLNGFVLYFALPAMLFRFGANTPMAQLLDGSVALLYTLSASVMVLLGMWTLKKHHNWNESAFGTMAVAFPNTGYMGLPLLLSLFGPAAVGPAIVTIVVDLFFTSSVCIALSRLDQAQTHGARTALVQAIKSVFSIPLTWAIGLGALVSSQGWVIPEMLNQTVGLLAGAAAPVALFTIGTLLARPVPVSAQGWWHWQRGGVDAVLVVLKLVVHPLVVVAMGWGLMYLGLPLTPTALMAVVLVAALPSASNSAVLAERFGADSARITRVILLSTALAFPSFSAWVAWYKA
jgi:predicted permease